MNPRELPLNDFNTVYELARVHSYKPNVQLNTVFNLGALLTLVKRGGSLLLNNGPLTTVSKLAMEGCVEGVDCIIHLTGIDYLIDLADDKDQPRAFAEAVYGYSLVGDIKNVERCLSWATENIRSREALPAIRQMIECAKPLRMAIQQLGLNLEEALKFTELDLACKIWLLQGPLLVNSRVTSADIFLAITRELLNTDEKTCMRLYQASCMRLFLACKDDTKEERYVARINRL